MKLLAKKIFNSNIFVFLRNNLNIKTKRFKLNNLKKVLVLATLFIGVLIMVLKLYLDLLIY